MEGADAAMRLRIDVALDEVERAHGVRIVLAVESGSRAWGFPSRDSDWDVRFIYAHPRARYLSIDPPRDVIETPLLDGLDLGGWDLRKALGLLVKSNAVVLEWLSSPVVYRRDAEAGTALASLAARAAHVPALEYHYDRLARRSWAPPPQPLRIKDMFYAFRSACALAWMQASNTPPPMAPAELMAGLPLSAKLGVEIGALLARKLDGGEEDQEDAPPELSAFMAVVLARLAGQAASWERGTILDEANCMFRRFAGP